MKCNMPKAIFTCSALIGLVLVVAFGLFTAGYEETAQTVAVFGMAIACVLPFAAYEDLKRGGGPGPKSR